MLQSFHSSFLPKENENYLLCESLVRSGKQILLFVSEAKGKIMEDMYKRVTVASPQILLRQLQSLY